MKCHHLSSILVALAASFLFVACGSDTGGDGGTVDAAKSDTKAGEDTTFPDGQEAGYSVTVCVIATVDDAETCEEGVAMDFGSVGLGQSATRRARVSNTGTIAASLDSVTIESDAFTVRVLQIGDARTETETTLPLALDAGATALVEITLAAGQPTGALPAGKAIIKASGGDDDQSEDTINFKGEISGCADGTGDCDTDASNGCETDTLTSMDHCGSCDKPCAAVNGTAACADGACKGTGDTGWEGDTCETDTDECAADPAPCDANATCTNTDGSYTCACNDGWTGDGTACADIDECTDASLSNCDANATCENTDGSFTCTCITGWAGDGATCADVDECAADPAPCDTNATCDNSDGGYECSCNDGFTGDGATCADIDECAVEIAPCDATFATCANTYGSFTCTCNAGWAGDGATCTDVDECAPQMKADWMMEGSACEVCVTGQDNWCKGKMDNATFCLPCATGAGTSYCDADACTDACVEGPPTADCAPTASCANTEGGYTCTCPDGFEGDGKTCTDIDECLDPTLFECDKNATCSNTDSTYDCICNSGYDGSGKTCADQNECLPSLVKDYNKTGTACQGCTEGADSFCSEANWDSGCDSCAKGQGNNFGCPKNACDNDCLSILANCDANAACENTDGNFTCACNEGYAGDGFICSDMDECAMGTAVCDVNGSCKNTDGSYKCKCDDGYVGDGKECKPAAGPCDGVECLNGGKCEVDANGNGACSCTSDWTGDTCETSTNPCNNPDLNKCDKNAACTAAADGTMTCTCSKGWTGDGKTCTDINECGGLKADYATDAACIACVVAQDDWCKSNMSNEDYCKKCADGSGTPFCKTEACNKECVEPASVTCPLGTTCGNTDGGYECNCPDGQILSGEKCIEDIDECVLQLKAKYVTDQACIDCVKAEDDFCLTPNSGSNCIKCANGTGSTFCKANACNKECMETLDDCDDNATCTNAPVGYTCTCNEGFEGDGKTCNETNPSGACLNDADGAILTNMGNVSKAMQECSMAAQGNNASIGPCMAKKTGLSEPCAGCWGDYSGCFISTCFSACIPPGGSTSSPECTACLDKNCVPQMKECSGIAPSMGGPPGGIEVNISIAGSMFQPANLQLPVGATLIWTNKDQVDHTVTSIGGNGPLNSKILKPGDSYSYTFTATGTYDYECTIHPSMKASVTISGSPGGGPGGGQP